MLVWYQIARDTRKVSPIDNKWTVLQFTMEHPNAPVSSTIAAAFMFKDDAEEWIARNQ